MPWYMRPSGRNAKVVEGWDYRVVDLELVEAEGDVSSGAPGGVNGGE